MKLLSAANIISKTLLNLLLKAKAGEAGFNKVMIFMVTSFPKKQS